MTWLLSCPWHYPPLYGCLFESIMVQGWAEVQTKVDWWLRESSPEIGTWTYVSNHVRSSLETRTSMGVSDYVRSSPGRRAPNGPMGVIDHVRSSPKTGTPMGVSDHVWSSPGMRTPMDVSDHVRSSLGTKTTMGEGVQVKWSTWLLLSWEGKYSRLTQNTAQTVTLARNRCHPHQESEWLWPPSEVEGEWSKSILVKGKWTKMWTKMKMECKRVYGCDSHRNYECERSKSILVKIVMQNYTYRLWQWQWRGKNNYNNETPCKVVLMTMKAGWSSVDEDNKRC